MASLSLSNSQQEISNQIGSLKTFSTVLTSEKDLLNNAANSSSLSVSALATQLDKIKDQQKRYERDPSTSMNQLIKFVGETRGNGYQTLAYLRKKLFETAVQMEPKIAAILKEQTIKALGCSQSQTYQGVSPEMAKLQPLPTLPQQQGIYIPVQSVDFFSNLKNSPKSAIGRAYYEAPNPSSDMKFIPFGGPISFPMNKL